MILDGVAVHRCGKGIGLNTAFVPRPAILFMIGSGRLGQSQSRMDDTDEISEDAKEPEDSWNRLRGILKDVFTELDGGEAYLRAERSNFQSTKAE